MNTKEYRAANKKMEHLLNILTDNGELPKHLEKQLDQVSEAIASYEEEKYPFKPESLVEMIELRMYQRQLKRKDLARILETTPSRVSEFLNGKRDLTIKMARALYRKLNIDPSLILQESKEH